MRAPGIGIIGIGKYVPPTIRRNSDWPESFLTAQQKSDKNISVTTEKRSALMDTDSGRIAIEEMAKWKNDPFFGARERRIADGLKSSDMEYEAALDALRVTGLKPSDIGLLMVYSFTPDQIMPDNAGVLHSRLGLGTSIPAMAVTGACGSFLLQMQLAPPYLLATRAKYALLVQSALQSVVTNYDEPVSVTFGDAATAVVLGKVGDNSGILSCQTSIDGTYAKTVVIAPDGEAPWYNPQGRLWYTSQDYPRTRELIFRIADMAKDTLHRALREAELSSADVTTFTSHQTIAAFSNIARRGAGFDHARLLDTFPEFGSLAASTIPLNLAVGAERGLMKRGDTVAMFTTGTGFNWSGAIVRW